MRDVPQTLIDRIQSGASTLCHVWLLTRRDGARLGFTDHDADLTADGVVCQAGAGWTAGAASAELGLAPGHAATTGALDSAALDPADIDAGLYDGAQVECRRLDWTDPSLFVTLWSAAITRLKREGGAFQADLEGPLAQLDKVVGRTFSRSCDADLGDGRCGVSHAHPAFAQGCDKSAATCADRFANLARFRGFPAIPGDDFLTVYPGEGERHDGTSRRS